MDFREADLAARIYRAIQNYTVNDERGQQTQQFKVGVSDLGYCSERTRRMLDRQTYDHEPDMLKAFLGTAIGDHAERAIEVSWDSPVIRQSEVTLRMRGMGGRHYDVTGHPDIVIPAENLVLDGKTSFGLAMAERLGADQQKRFQRHAYGMGALLAGMLDTDKPEDVVVGNFWLDRSGKEQRVHVEAEPLSMDVLAAAEEWLDAVVYAFLNGEEAQKEPAREVCATTCGFYRTCREYDTDVRGLLTDPEVVEAINMYDQGQDMERVGKSLKEQAKPFLTDISGSTGEFTLRWIHVNAARPYDKIEVRRVTERPTP